MAISNVERLIQMAENVFAARSDPDQLDVDWKVLERLRKIHPATVSDFDEGMGPVAWVFGSEGQGIGPDVADAVRSRVLIPMPGNVESLNVAAAAAICLFETVRQRLG